MLTNIIGNAVKFTSEGFVKIGCNTTTTNQDVNIEFTIKDSGIGITKEQQSRLFNPFSQADSSTTRQFGGTGLGLSIANRLCKLMHGGIQLHSTLGKGSEFVISIQATSSSKPSTFTQNLGKSFSKVVCLVAKENEEGIVPLLEKWESNLIKVSNTDELNEVYKRLKNLKKMNKPAMFCIDCQYFLQSQDLCTQIVNEGGIVLVLSNVSDSIALKNETGFSALCNYTVTPMSLRQALFSMPSRNKTKQSEEQEISAGDIRILVVEDNAINTEVTTHMLKNLGFQFSSAENGKLAIEILIAQPDNFDLILMDCQMPEMDGFTATQRIRMGYANEAYRTIPIIALTANAMAGDREKCAEAGMDDYLSKPLEFSVLQNMLADYLHIESLR